MEATLVRSKDPEVLVHSWDRGSSSRANPVSFIPRAYVTKRSKGLQVRKSGKSLKWISFHEAGFPNTIDIVGDLAHADMRAVAVYALEVEDMLARTIGGPPKTIPFRLRFFSKKLEFSLMAMKVGASNAMSYYAPATRDVVMWFDETMTHDYLQELIAHELTHAYMDIVNECNGPLWFQEGMAEYFQHFTWENGRLEPGAINEVELANLMSEGGPIPIEEFVKVPRSRMYGPEFKRLYAQAWTVVHFLAEYAPEAIKELLQRRPINVHGLDREWQTHLRAMVGPSR
jgi:hypothetical protein